MNTKSKRRKLTRKIKNSLLAFATDPAFRLGMIFSFLLLFSMIAILLIERETNEGFQNLFDSFWYTIVTITTVGYGDKSPLTPIGKIIGIITMGFGIVIFGSVTGKIASFLVDQQLRKGRGMIKLKNLTGHFIICGWKKDFEKIIDGVLEANPDINTNEIVLINTAPQEIMEPFLANVKYRQLKFIYGDFIEESVLQRANIKTAAKVLILADELQNSSPLEIDSRTVLAVLTIENLNRNLYTAAELMDEKFEKHLSFAHCDEIILSRQYERKLLVNASSGTGVSHVVDDLLSYENQKGLAIIAIPDRFIGNDFNALFHFFYEEKNSILIGVLENTGNFYARKREALNEAQKTPNITKIVNNLKKVKELKSNKSVLAPGEKYIIQQNSRAIVVGEYSNIQVHEEL